MARALFGVEKGVRLFAENGAPGVDFLFGSAAPGGDSGAQDAAGVGSVYARTDGSFYLKTGTGNVAADWVRTATLNDVFALSWRSEKVVAATGDAAPADDTVIDLVANPFGDDEAPLLVAADFTVGDHIIFGVGGTPKLMKVTLVSGDEITVTSAAIDPLADNDSFVVRNYLPDTPADQEAYSIVTFNGTAIVKISDFNWALASGINLTGSYAGTTNGTPAAGDSVETAIGKLDANQRDLTTLSGVAQGAVDLGSFTGDIIPDSQTVKQALQALETELVDTRQNVDDLITLSGVSENATDLGTFTGYTIPDNSTVKSALQSLETALEGRAQATGVTTAVTVDSVSVDNVKAVEWEVHVFEEATPANVRVEKILALHNGTASADATSVDDVSFGVIKLGGNFNLTLSVDLNGTGGSQVMRLRAASTSAGVTVTTRRIEIR